MPLEMSLYLENFMLLTHGFTKPSIDCTRGVFLDAMIMSLCTSGAVRDELFVDGEETRLILIVIREPFASLTSIALLCAFLRICGSMHRYKYSIYLSGTHNRWLETSAAISHFKHLPGIDSKTLPIKKGGITKDPTWALNYSPLHIFPSTNNAATEIFNKNRFLQRNNRPHPQNFQF